MYSRKMVPYINTILSFMILMLLLSPGVLAESVPENSDTPSTNSAEATNIPELPDNEDKQAQENVPEQENDNSPKSGNDDIPEPENETDSESENKKDEPGQQPQIDKYDFKALVKSSIVYAEVTMNSLVYTNGSKKSYVAGKAFKGSIVEVIEDTDTKWYKIRASNLLVGWVPASVLKIPPDPPTNKSLLSIEQLEKFVEFKGFTSSTDYLLWVDIDRQQTYIFKKSGTAWKHIKTFLCSTGLNKTPTRRGTFKIQEKGKWFYSGRYGSGALNWVRFSDGYLFHSVAMDKKQRIIDDTLGKRASHGCIRLSVENSLWVYNNIPARTTVFID